MSKKSSKGKCIIEGCSYLQKTRGLCNACRGVAKNLIKSGRATMEDLESMGLILPRLPNDRNKGKFTNSLVLAFLKAKSGQSEPKEEQS